MYFSGMDIDWILKSNSFYGVVASNGFDVPDLYENNDEYLDDALNILENSPYLYFLDSIKINWHVINEIKKKSKGEYCIDSFTESARKGYFAFDTCMDDGLQYLLACPDIMFDNRSSLDDLFKDSPVYEINKKLESSILKYVKNDFDDAFKKFHIF